MNRELAFDLLKKHLNKENLIKHSLAVEACMIKLANYFKEDEVKWGIAGLLHDLDYDYTVDTPHLHGSKTVDLLAPYKLDQTILHAIKAHNKLEPLKSRMDISLFSIDPATGFITACALMHPSKKLESINLKRMKKRFKEKNFARGADREQILNCVNLKIPMEDFLVLCLDAMSAINQELEL